MRLASRMKSGLVSSRAKSMSTGNGRSYHSERRPSGAARVHITSGKGWTSGTTSYAKASPARGGGWQRQSRYANGPFDHRVKAMKVSAASGKRLDRLAASGTGGGIHKGHGIRHRPAGGPRGGQFT